MEKFKKGNQYVNIDSAVTKNELTQIEHVKTENQNYSKIKFIPASGAATRMFKNLYSYLDDQLDTDFIEDFFKHLEEFAFFEELKKNIDMEQLEKKKKTAYISLKIY